MTNQDVFQAMLAQATRRRFLQRAGMVGLGAIVAPGLLAGCGDDETEDEAADRPADAGPAQAPKATGRIDYLSWEGYDIPDALKSWKQANDIQVKTNYIATHDDIQAKIKAAGGGGGYDIITYYQGYKPLYAQLKILEPIDEQKLPNLENLAEYWKGDLGNFWLDPDGTRTGVPWTWTTLGVTYDEAKIEPPGSYYDLLDAKFKGKVAIVDDPVGAFTLASHILGMRPDEVKKADQAKVSDFLAQMIAQSTGVSASFGDMTTKLTSGDAVVCFQGWTAMNQFAADAGTKTVKTVFPKEGGFTSCDCWAIPTTADNADAAYGWINESLDPKVHAAAADYVVGGVTVDAAYPECSKAVQKLYPVDKLEESLEVAPLYNNPPVESDEFVTFEEVQKSWQALKAGGQG
jgi:spermidine/putrescine transport system substrate-binding protein